MPGGRKARFGLLRDRQCDDVAWLVADTLQPASYSPLRQTVSVLAAGRVRWRRARRRRAG
jgi:hypothetical protein